MVTLVSEHRQYKNDVSIDGDTSIFVFHYPELRITSNVTSRISKKELLKAVPFPMFLAGRFRVKYKV